MPFYPASRAGKLHSWKPRGTGGGAGEATTLDEDLPTLTIERTTGATEYPPNIRVYTTPENEVGDAIELWTDDEHTFAAPRTDETSVTVDAAVYAAGQADFGLSAVLSGSKFFNARTVRGAFHGPASNTVNVGDTVAPTMTSANSFNATENESTNFALAADEGATFAVVGGTFSGDASIVGSTLTLAAQNREVDGTSGTIIIRPTDYAGNVGSDQTITATVLDVDEAPNAYSFTDTTDAALSTVYTSTITIAGLAASEIVSGTFSGDGDYRKNGGAWVTTSPFTATNGDTFESRLTSSGAATTTVSNTFSLGEPAVNDTHSVITAASLPAIGGTWSTIGDPDTATMYQGVTAGGTPATADGDPVGYIEDVSAANFDWKAAAATGVRPTLDITGSVTSLVFDGTDDYLRAATDVALGAYAAGSATLVFAGKFNPANTAALFGEGHSVDNDTAYVFREYGSSTTGEVEAFVRNDAASLFAFSSNSNLNAGSPKAFDNNYRVIVIVDTGSAMTLYVDRVKMTTRTYTRSGALGPDRVSVMGWLRGAVSTLMAGELQWWAVVNGYNFTDGGVATGATANGEVGSVSTYAATKQARSV